MAEALVLPIYHYPKRKQIRIRKYRKTPVEHNPVVWHARQSGIKKLASTTEQDSENMVFRQHLLNRTALSTTDTAHSLLPWSHSVR